MGCKCDCNLRPYKILSSVIGRNKGAVGTYFLRQHLLAFFKRIFRFHHQPISQFSSRRKGYCKKKHLRTHVILRWESCGQTFPTVVAHGQASKEKIQKVVRPFLDTLAQKSDRKQGWMVGRGERRRGRKNLPARPKNGISHTNHTNHARAFCFFVFFLIIFHSLSSFVHYISKAQDILIAD